MKNKQGTILIICGPSGVGKDTVLNILSKRMGFKQLVSYTTRPIRPSETKGKEYLFIDDKTHFTLDKNGKILSARTYYTKQNGKDAVWHYGLPYPPTDELYLVIVDHQGALNIINKMGEDKVQVVYLHAKRSILEERCADRGDEKTEYQRRLDDDILQFYGIEHIANLLINTGILNPEESVDMIIENFHS